MAKEILCTFGTDIDAFAGQIGSYGGGDLPSDIQRGIFASEVGAQGYLHENPIAMTLTREEAVLVKLIELIEKLSGQKPRGYVAPWWEMPASTAALLQKYGFKYDHSQGYRDFQPFDARVRSAWQFSANIKCRGSPLCSKAASHITTRVNAAPMARRRHAGLTEADNF